MAIVLNGSAGITNDGGYTGDGVVFADTTPANTLVTTTGGNVGVGITYGLSKLTVGGQSAGADGAYATGRGSIVLNETNRSSVNDTGGFEFKTSVFGSGYGAKIMALDNGTLVFGNRDNSATYNERARIDSTGNLLVGTTTALAGYTDAYLHVATVNGGKRGITIGNSSGSTGTGCITFVNSNGQVGYILTSGSTTTYATSSDYRLKENIQPMTGALAKVQSLKPCTYKWKVDGSDGQGFVAHELAEVEPGCVTGKKDAVDAKGKPVYQGIDTSFLVATLTAAIQEQQQLITALTARVAALEGTQP